MTFFMRINRSGRTNEKLDLVPYFDDLLNHVESIRASLRPYRKFLENCHSSILKMSHTEKLEKGSEDCPLNALINIQQLCCNIQMQFAEEVGTFIRLLKEWETFCDSIMRSKYDLQKTHATKEKDRLRGGDACSSSEIAYQSQKDELYKMLTRYFSAEMESQRKVMEFQTKLSSFFISCANEVEKSSDNRQLTSCLSGRIFGASLENHLDADGYSTVLRSILAYLTKNRAYTREGIFRVSGQVSGINVLKNALERGMADEELFDCCGIFEVADLMKQYLRDLSEPILPTRLLKNWPTETPNVEMVKKLIMQHVGESNRRNLFLLLKFLSEVVENQSSSKMTSENLTVTLWKSFRSNSESFNVPKVVQYLICNAKPLLEGEKEATLLYSHPVQPHREYRESGKPRAPPPPRPNPPAYSPQISISEVTGPNVARHTSAPKPPTSPTLVTSFIGPDGRSSSEAHVEIDRDTLKTPLQPSNLEQLEASTTREQISHTTDTEVKSTKDVPNNESGIEGSEQSDEDISLDMPTSSPKEEARKHNHEKTSKNHIEESKKKDTKKKDKKLKFDESHDSDESAGSINRKNDQQSAIESLQDSDEETKEPDSQASSRSPRSTSAHKE